MKKIAVLCALAAGLSVSLVQAEEERFIDKASRTTKKAGEVMEKGLEKGASAASKGVTKAFEVTTEKVLAPTDRWIQDKVGRPGAGNSKAAPPAGNSP